MATTHVRKAARKALSNYLATQVADGVVFYDRFPPAGAKLNKGAISVILAPSKDKEHKFQPAAMAQTPIDGDSINAMVLFSWGIVEFGLQVDVWADTPALRDALELQVEAALNRPPGVTLANGPSWATDLAPGLVIEVPDNYSTTCALRFSAFPGLPETGMVVQQADWRATWTGSGVAHLLRQIKRPLIKELQIILSDYSGIVTVPGAVYFGVSTIPVVYDARFVADTIGQQGMVVSPGRTRSLSYVAAMNEYCYYSYPVSYGGVPSNFIDADTFFVAGFENVATVTIGNVDYWVWKSIQDGLGVFRVNVT